VVVVVDHHVVLVDVDVDIDVDVAAGVVYHPPPDHAPCTS
jgi:hypothetical protein